MSENPYLAAARFRAGLRQFLRTSEEHARRVGLTPRQHLLLLQIAGSEDGTATISQLVTSLALSQSAITELVQRAEAAGLINRSQSPDDGRVSHLSLTATGESKLAAVHDALGPERAELRRVMDTLEHN
jgi:DNA-binding MarR family transcriptional regulator